MDHMPAVSLFIRNATVTNEMSYLLQMYHLQPSGLKMIRPQVYIQIAYLLTNVPPGTDWINNDPTTGVQPAGTCPGIDWIYNDPMTGVPYYT